MSFTALRLSLFTALMAAGPALADLTTAEMQQLKTLRGVDVVSSDGGLVGRIEGASVNSDRAALFLRSASGSFLPYRGSDIIVTTAPSEITLRDGAIVLDANSQRIGAKATRVKSGDDRVEISLPAR